MNEYLAYIYTCNRKLCEYLAAYVWEHLAGVCDRGSQLFMVNIV